MKEIKGHLKTLLGNYKNGVGIWDKAIPADLCDSMIEYFKERDPYESVVSGKNLKKEVRNSLEVNIKEDTEASEAIFEIVSEAILQYLDHHKPILKTFGATSWEPPTILKYLKGNGFYEWHTDSDVLKHKDSRILSVIIYLNDVKEGGETEFKFIEDIKVKPTKGRLTIFPSGWIHHHRGAVSIKNDKMILVSWLRKMPMPEGVEITRAE